MSFTANSPARPDPPTTSSASGSASHGAPELTPQLDAAGPSTCIRVGVVNDYAVIVAGLVALLAEFADRIELVPFALGSTSLDHDVDVVLVDVFAYAGDLNEYIASIPAKVVVFSNVTHPQAVLAVVAAGAAGYVFKGAQPEQILDALLTVAGSTTPVVVLQQTTPSEANASALWPGIESQLTERESEMLALICQGLTNKQIATQLYLSINSVKTYVRLAYRKIGVDSRSKAVVWGLQNGFATRS